MNGNTLSTQSNQTNYCPERFYIEEIVNISLTNLSNTITIQNIVYKYSGTLQSGIDFLPHPINCLKKCIPWHSCCNPFPPLLILMKDGIVQPRLRICIARWAHKKREIAIKSTDKVADCCTNDGSIEMGWWKQVSYVGKYLRPFNFCVSLI